MLKRTVIQSRNEKIKNKQTKRSKLKILFFFIRNHTYFETILLDESERKAIGAHQSINPSIQHFSVIFQVEIFYGQSNTMKKISKIWFEITFKFTK